MTQEQLDQIRERCEKATPGDWRTPPAFSGIVSMKHGDIAYLCASNNNTINDFLFISHAREDVPALLEEVYRLSDELEFLQLDPAAIRAQLVEGDRQTAENADLRAQLDAAVAQLMLAMRERDTLMKSACGRCDTCAKYFVDDFLCIDSVEYSLDEIDPSAKRDCKDWKWRGIVQDVGDAK